MGRLQAMKKFTVQIKVGDEIEVGRFPMPKQRSKDIVTDEYGQS